LRNLETILVNSYPSKSIVGRSGAGRSVGEVVDREDDAEAVDRREVLRDLGVVGPVGGEHPRLLGGVVVLAELLPLDAGPVLLEEALDALGVLADDEVRLAQELAVLVALLVRPDDADFRLRQASSSSYFTR
jgi:hypothetical protein